MRNLEECKVEVFRRSKERIKTRKKMKQRVTVCCASLCILLVAGVALQRFGPVDELFMIHSDGAVESVAPEYASVRSTKDGSSYQLHYRTSDKEAAKSSYDVLAQFFGDEVTTEQNISKGEAEGDVLFGNPTGEEADFSITDGKDPLIRDTIKDDIKYKLNAACGSTEQATIYEFIFRIEEGEKAVFRLIGNELTDKTNDRKIVLTEEQLSALKTQFEITEE